MKEKIKSVYYCDFCKKKGLSKHAMVEHEKWCYSNPENISACSGCIHLKTEEHTVYYHYNNEYGQDEIPAKSTAYSCEKTGKGLYPLKALKKDLPNRYPDQFENSTLFPKECEFKKTYLLFQP